MIIYQLRHLPRREVKAYAFSYHYGAFKTEVEARRSLAGQAAAELARRDGRMMPAPTLMNRWLRL